MASFPPLECPQIVFRTIFRKEWIRKDGSFKWQAFKPYLNDQDGVSVFIESADIDAHSEKPYFGIGSVKVGRLRDCSTNEFHLDVIQDTGWHANITIPYHYNPDKTESPELRAKMMDCCTTIIKSPAVREFKPK